MTKKSSKKATKPLAADEPANRPATNHPTDKQATNSRRVGLGGAAAEATQAVTPPAEAPLAEEPAKLLTPLVAAWPKAGLPAPPKSPEKTAVGEKAPTPIAPQSDKATFVLLEPEAKQVSLCGDFNGWASNAMPMKRHSGGYWETTVALAPGRHEYKFWVDGQWISDPLAKESVPNPFGGRNSILEVVNSQEEAHLADVEKLPLKKAT